jgi:transposase
VARPTLGHLAGLVRRRVRRRHPGGLAATIEQWWTYMLEFIHTGISNATSEGINRVFKLEARKAYGFRNPVNQRLRVRCATTRRARGHLQARLSS